MVGVNQKSIDELRARLRGPLLVPGDSEYETSRTVWNAMIDRRPALVARCLGIADVATGLRFAREYGLPVSIKGGGHNVAGLATCDEGLMLDMSLMRGVWVDPQARTARAQAGCLLGDVDRETQVHGLATALGFISNTGIAGLTLGGGFGYLTRRSGWTSDNLSAVDLVRGYALVACNDEAERAVVGAVGLGSDLVAEPLHPASERLPVSLAPEMDPVPDLTGRPQRIAHIQQAVENVHIGHPLKILA